MTVNPVDFRDAPKRPATRVQARRPDTYKQAQDAYLRARAILQHKHGRHILPVEDAMLYYGFHVWGQDPDENLGPVWDEVADAAKLAQDGYGVKQGEIRPTAEPLD